MDFRKTHVQRDHRRRRVPVVARPRVLPVRAVDERVCAMTLRATRPGRGAIDPCFPSKVAVAHVHNLLFVKHRQKPLDCIFLPMFDVLRSPLVNLSGVNACPTASATPETVKAAFTREDDLFARYGIRYLSPLVNLSDRKLFARQMLGTWEPVLGLSETENERALGAGFDSLDAYEPRRSSHADGHRLGVLASRG